MRRSRHSKKSRRHNRKTRRQKGGYYGAGGPLAVGAMRWDAGSEMGGFTADQINKGAKMTGGRKRRHRRKTLRGGGKYGAVSASYEGTGSRGIADYRGIDTKTAPLPGRPAALGGFNDNGAPPGNFSKFAGMFPK
jgi:hypothetical protein